jgi:hypothetical protein
MADDVTTVLPENKKAKGPPLGSQNNLRHGVYALSSRRKHAKIDKRTSQYKAIKQIEQEITADHRQATKQWHASNAAWMEYYCRMLDAHLLSLKHPIRKGKVNPAVDLRLRFSEAVDRNLAALDAIVNGETEHMDLATKYKLGLIK